MRAAIAVDPVASASPGDALDRRPVDMSVTLLLGDRVGRGTVRSRLPYGVSEWTRFGPAPRLPYADATLSALAAVVRRCAPWVLVAAGPRVWARAREGADIGSFREIRRLPDDGVVHVLGGQAWCRPHVPDGAPELVLVATWCGTTIAVATLHHELWHVLEYHLAAEDLDAVDRAVRRGGELPGDYLSSAVERRARLYESWASARDEGWRPPSLVGWPVRRVDRILDYVHSGRLARDVERRGAGQPQIGPVHRLGRAVVAFLRWL